MKASATPDDEDDHRVEVSEILVPLFVYKKTPAGRVFLRRE